MDEFKNPIGAITMPDATTNIFGPINPITACVDSVAGIPSDPGAVGTGAIGIGLAIRNSANPYVGAAQALGAEAAGFCAYGAINAAAENYVNNMDTSAVNIEPINVPINPPGDINTMTLDTIGNISE